MHVILGEPYELLNIAVRSLSNSCIRIDSRIKFLLLLFYDIEDR